jgi:hypothetical protein
MLINDIPKCLRKISIGNRQKLWWRDQKSNQRPLINIGDKIKTNNMSVNVICEKIKVTKEHGAKKLAWYLLNFRAEITSRFID